MNKMELIDVMADKAGITKKMQKSIECIYSNNRRNIKKWKQGSINWIWHF